MWRKEEIIIVRGFKKEMVHRFHSRTILELEEGLKLETMTVRDCEKILKRNLFRLRGIEILRNRDFEIMRKTKSERRRECERL